MKTIDRFLNGITMYKLVLWGLMILAGVSIILAFVKLIPYGGLSYIFSLLILFPTCYFTNIVLSKIFNVVPNVESSSITALILFFILLPAETLPDALIIFLAGAIAMASKFVIAPGRRHIFNPAAIAIVILEILGSGNAIWWIGSVVLLPFVLILGFLVVRKIRRFTLFFTFIGTSILVSAVAFVIVVGSESLIEFFRATLLSSPLFFFGSIMLTEPLTNAPTKKLQVFYGVLVGALGGIPFSIGPFFTSPELSLSIGNIFSYLVGWKRRLILNLADKRTIARDTEEFVFKGTKARFMPGQYAEWTLLDEKPDSRGNRRYFTIASSPTEPDIKIGVKMNPDPSSFKTALMKVSKNNRIAAGTIGGDFTLPNNTKEKLAFIAGGIGVTPFRSMIKYLTDMKESRDIVLFYNVKASTEEIAYRDIFAEAERAIGLKTVYVISDGKTIPNWNGETGFITKEMLERRAPDYKARTFYLSGPNVMVDSYKKLLYSLGVSKTKIRTDYFPGF